MNQRKSKQQAKASQNEPTQTKAQACCLLWLFPCCVLCFLLCCLLCVFAWLLVLLLALLIASFFAACFALLLTLRFALPAASLFAWICAVFLSWVVFCWCALLFAYACSSVLCFGPFLPPCWYLLAPGAFWGHKLELWSIVGRLFGNRLLHVGTLFLSCLCLFDSILFHVGPFGLHFGICLILSGCPGALGGTRSRFCWLLVDEWCHVRSIWRTLLYHFASLFRCHLSDACLSALWSMISSSVAPYLEHFDTCSRPGSISEPKLRLSRT